MRARQAYRLKSRGRAKVEPATRREEGGREVCQANAVGRAEYTRRKQLLWERQGGRCQSCQMRMTIPDARMTGGDWQPTGQLRDDRIEASDGSRQVNWLVHKACLQRYHDEHPRQPQQPSQLYPGAGTGPGF